METTTFSRKPFEVDAVQVTEENIQEVAAWCRGKIQHAERKGTVEPYIKVQTHRPLNEKQTMAFIGDWILQAETGFKVYTDQAMQNSFQEQPKHRNVFEDNAEETHAAVQEILAEEPEPVGEVPELPPVVRSPFKFLEED